MVLLVSSELNAEKRKESQLGDDSDEDLNKSVRPRPQNKVRFIINKNKEYVN